MMANGEDRGDVTPNETKQLPPERKPPNATFFFSMLVMVFGLFGLSAWFLYIAANNMMTFVLEGLTASGASSLVFGGFTLMYGSVLGYMTLQGVKWYWQKEDAA